MIKISFYELDCLYSELSNISKIKPTGNKSGLLSYTIAKTIKMIQLDYEAFLEARKLINDKYLDKIIKDENGKPLVVDGKVEILPDFKQHHAREIIDLLNSVIDIDVNKISVSWLLENYDLTPDQFTHLMPIIEDDIVDKSDTNHNTKTE